MGLAADFTFYARSVLDNALEGWADLGLNSLPVAPPSLSLVVSTTPGPGEFYSFGGAMAYLRTLKLTSYVDIAVRPGVYDEPEIDLNHVDGRYISIEADNDGLNQPSLVSILNGAKIDAGCSLRKLEGVKFDGSGGLSLNASATITDVLLCHFLNDITLSRRSYAHIVGCVMDSMSIISTDSSLNIGGYDDFVVFNTPGWSGTFVTIDGGSCSMSQSSSGSYQNNVTGSSIAETNFLEAINGAEFKNISSSSTLYVLWTATNINTIFRASNGAQIKSGTSHVQTNCVDGIVCESGSRVDGSAPASGVTNQYNIPVGVHQTDGSVIFN